MTPEESQSKLKLDAEYATFGLGCFGFVIVVIIIVLVSYFLTK